MHVSVCICVSQVHELGRSGILWMSRLLSLLVATGTGCSQPQPIGEGLELPGKLPLRYLTVIWLSISSVMQTGTT